MFFRCRESSTILFRHCVGLSGVRKQRQMPGSLNCNSNCALVFGAHAGLPARANLTIFRDEAAQHLNLLVVDDRASIGAKLADARV
jgi:hypothetical protein